MRSPAADRVLAACLGLWLGAILLSGGIAAVAFPTMKALAPTIPSMPTLEDPWLVAAGVVAQRGFTIAGVVQAIAAAIALLAARFARRDPGSPARGGLVLCGLIASVLLLGASAFLQRRMNADFAAYLQAARQSDTATTASHRDAFRAAHPWASRLLGGQALAAAVTLAGLCRPARRAETIG